jgi:hypothetical protein
VFGLGAGAARSVACPVCGGVLTVAVPVVPPPAPPPPPPPPPPAPVRPPAPAKPPTAPGDLDDLHPEDRAWHLVPPWPIVRTALSSARVTATIAKWLIFLILGVAYIAAVTTQRNSRGDEEPVVGVCAGVLLVLPALVHLANQFACVQVPRVYGGRLVRGCVVCLGFSFCGLLGLPLTPMPAALLLGAVSVLGMVISCGLWVAFLARLGERLGDRALCAGMRSFTVWYWLGSVSIVTLFAGPYLAHGKSERGVLLWCCWAGAGATTAFLLHRYALMLGRAVRAIARRGPVEPHS